VQSLGDDFIRLQRPRRGLGRCGIHERPFIDLMIERSGPTLGLLWVVAFVEISYAVEAQSIKRERNPISPRQPFHPMSQGLATLLLHTVGPLNSNLVTRMADPLVPDLWRARPHAYNPQVRSIGAP